MKNLHHKYECSSSHLKAGVPSGQTGRNGEHVHFWFGKVLVRFICVRTNDCWEFVYEIGGGACQQNYTPNHIFDPGRSPLQLLCKPVKMMRMRPDMNGVQGAFKSVEI